MLPWIKVLSALSTLITLIRGSGATVVLALNPGGWLFRSMRGAYPTRTSRTAPSFGALVVAAPVVFVTPSVSYAAYIYKV